MRVTHTMMSRDLLAQVNNIRTRLQQDHEKLASGKRIRRPSDDPAGAARLLRLRQELAVTGQYERNLTQAEVRLSVTSDVLNRVTNLIGQVQAKASSAITDTAGADARNAVAAELDQIVESLVALSSTTVEGRKIFAGSQIDTEPLVESGGNYVYQGDSREIRVQIEGDRSLRVNATADEVFTHPSADLVNGITALAEALRNDDDPGARALLEDLTAAADQINDVRVRVSQGLAEVERARPALEERRLALTREVSRLEDADMAELISQLALDETSLQATLQAGARVQQQLSLFDVLA